MPKKKISKGLPKLDKGQLALFVKAASGEVEEDTTEMKEKASTAMVRADERAILSGIEGQMAMGWVYQYTQGNQTVTGISYPGFRELYRRCFKTDRLQWAEFPIVTMTPKDEDPRGPTLVAYGVICNLKHLKEQWPVFAEEPLMKWRSEGSSRPNYHARAVVIGKHLRNAMKLVCPDRQAAAFLDHCLKEKKKVERIVGSGSGIEKASPVRTARLNQLFSMAKGYGLNINDQETRKKFTEFLAGQFKMRLSAMNDDQLGSVGQWLRDSVDKHGKDMFIGAVENVTIQGA